MSIFASKNNEVNPQELVTAGAFAGFMAAISTPRIAFPRIVDRFVIERLGRVIDWGPDTKLKGESSFEKFKKHSMFSSPSSFC
jgi:hypothetical protein